ncbi:hypothetical protein HK100_001862, partial [Physocladia obscura]
NYAISVTARNLQGRIDSLRANGFSHGEDEVVVKEAVQKELDPGGNKQVDWRGWHEGRGRRSPAGPRVVASAPTGLVLGASGGSRSKRFPHSNPTRTRRVRTRASEVAINSRKSPLRRPSHRVFLRHQRSRSHRQICAFSCPRRGQTIVQTHRLCAVLSFSVTTATAYQLHSIVTPTAKIAKLYLWSVPSLPHCACRNRDIDGDDGKIKTQKKKAINKDIEEIKGDVPLLCVTVLEAVVVIGVAAQVAETTLPDTAETDVKLIPSLLEVEIRSGTSGKAIANGIGVHS